MTKLVAQSNISTIERLIRTVRRERIILDSDLAKRYGTETKVLVQAINGTSIVFPGISCSNSHEESSIL